ncbi:hypothetical protein Q5424_25810 [Conexibacter sp. JD483]|uniref:hypothetical protein n=1 Tax=unclassified Conexibacter TaxID=2627773 RepID=UPI0027189C47|nr:MULTISPECIES: hypothetical protein [unclassified Conexibacter]MDO8189362.1 hypothetical protein [Conexibacter sp. CPCC 205706]MDO8197361.1 hypothetical protein [Conexibacter sp. CPCC 205762]MDR9372541.1 hypothetical protein [Conexibacter sp. JD483]
MLTGRTTAARASRLAALVMPVVLIAAVTAALPAGAAAKAKTIRPLPGRFAGRCQHPKQREINNCPDVLLSSSTPTTQLYFQLAKTYCTGLEKEAPGVWSFVPEVTFKQGHFSRRFVYDNMIPGHHQDAGAIEVAFTLTGRYTASNRLRVVIAGKVTSAFAPNDSCKGVRFREVHTLSHVNY